MYCKICGAPSETEVCPNCAAQQQYQQQYQQPQYQEQYQQPQYQEQYQQPMYQDPYQQQYQAPQQPQYQQPVYQQPRPAGDLKSMWHTIIAIVGAVAIIIGLLTCFGVFDVYRTSSMGSKSESEYESFSDITEGLDALDESSATLYIGNIVFGLASIAAGLIGILYFLKITQNNPMFDQYIGSKIKLTPGFLMGVLIAGGAIVQFLMYLFAGIDIGEVEVSFGINWISWVMLVVGAGVAAADKFVVNKEQ